LSKKLQVIGHEGPRPFMRGILVQSLVTRGIPFEVALGAATQIRDQVAPRGSITTEELSKLLERVLGDAYDMEPPKRPGEEPARVVTGRGSTPFSKGILAVSLEGAGLDRKDAFDVALEVEARLLPENRAEIERSSLRALVAEAIERRHGSNAAERYRVWRAAREDPRPIFVLLGGATGAGKTSISVEVARRLEIARVIGTDSIRQIMRLMFSADLMPELDGSTFDVHERLLPEGLESGDAVVAGFRAQAQKIAVGVRALLDRGVEEGLSMVIEGATLLPGILDLDPYRRRAHVIFLVVANLDESAFGARFEARALRERERGPRRYIEHMPEILAIQEHILSEAEDVGLPIIDNVHFDDAVLSVIRSVIATLKKSIVVPVEPDGP
jgi:2-phosphoglycerate kinase